MRTPPCLAICRPGRPMPKVAGALLVVLAITACDNPAPGEGVDHEPMATTPPAVVPAPEAIDSANIPTSDPTTMNQAEIDKALPAGSRCGFAYTAESLPVLAAAVAENEAAGVFKLHGRLVRLSAEEITDFAMLTTGGEFTAEGVRLTVMPIAGETWEGMDSGQHQRPANLRFELEQGLRRDYRGWYRCDKASSD